MMAKMTSNKPYLIRALYEWLVDNDATPHIMVDTTNSDVKIPSGIDKDGQVVLNIAARAVQGLEISNAYISFSARFAGASRNIFIPIGAVMAIYSMEDGEGMMFAGETEGADASATEAKKTADKSARKGPGLKVVK